MPFSFSSGQSHLSYSLVQEMFPAKGWMNDAAAASASLLYGREGNRHTLTHTTLLLPLFFLQSPFGHSTADHKASLCSKI